MVTDIDTHVGKRLRRRRRQLGHTQESLGKDVGVRFQQIQKYECGANRITVSRLFRLSTALNVDVNFFFDGLVKDGKQTPANDDDDLNEILSQKETANLVRIYARLTPQQQHLVLKLAKALEGEGALTSAAS